VKVTLPRLAGPLLAVVSIAATVGPVGAAPAELPREKDRWIRVDTEHFTLFSNASEAAARSAGADLEQLRLVLSMLFDHMRLESPAPTYMYVFDTPASFAPYRLYYRGRPREIAGYFTSRPLGNYAAIVSQNSRDDITRTIYHEYIHSVLDTNRAELPLWLNEGLAELYSTFDVVRGKARIGNPIGQHLLWLRGNGMIPLAELFNIDRDSPDYNEGSRRGGFYAQSWALTHMLVIGQPERQAQLSAFLRLLGRGVDTDEAFDRAFDTTYDELENELRRYVKGRRFSYSWVSVDDTATPGISVSPLEYSDVLYRLGDLLVGAVPERAELAAKHFRAALAIDPNHGPALAGLGRLDELAGRDSDALARYEKAAELAPDDLRINYLLGARLSHDLSHVEPREARLAQAERARAALRHAVELQPDFAEAWADLGYTFTWQLEPDAAGIEALRTAHRLLPKRGDVGYNLVLLQVRSGDTAGAEATIERMAATGIDRTIVESARELMFEIDLRRARELARDGRTDEARKILAEVGAATGDAELRQRIQHDIEALAEPEPPDDDFLERYNESVRLVNSGDLDAAIDSLEALEDAAATEDQAARARELLDRTRTYGAFRQRAETALRLANSRRVDEAIALLEELEGDAPDADQAAAVSSLLGRLRADRDFERRYAAAAAEVNAGNYESAIEMLEPLLEEAPDQRRETRVRRLLDDLYAIRDR
jgi:tetratricopeptide (TPR) repeat protein